MMHGQTQIKITESVCTQENLLENVFQEALTEIF
jgi:hypothetical protein